MRRFFRKKFFIKKFFKKKFFILLLLPLTFIFVLQLFSLKDCAKISGFVTPCSDMLAKYGLDDGLDVSLEKLWSILEGRKVSYSEINSPDFLVKAKERTVYVPSSEIKANGIACISYAFVSEELPYYAKRYVTIHENIHLEGERNETRTNYLAARKEPFGFIQTIFYSLWLNFKNIKFSKIPCRLGGLWNIFKIYFLKF